jgi:hypothetical protein
MPLLDKYSGRGISDCHPRPEVPTGVKRCRDRALALKCVPSLRASRLRVGAVGEGLPSLPPAGKQNQIRLMCGGREDAVAWELLGVSAPVRVRVSPPRHETHKMHQPTSIGLNTGCL